MFGGVMNAFSGGGGGGGDDDFADLNAKLQAKYQQYGQRTERRLREAYENRDTVEESQRTAEKARTLMSGIEDRNRSRAGSDTRSEPEQKADAARRMLNKNKEVANAANSARVADQEFKARTLGTLANQGANLRDSAQDALGRAGKMKQQREAAEQDSSFGSTLGSMVGMGAGAFLGGPAGAAVGGQIGGQVGGSFDD